jgi:dTDP-4-amino-4,6-dideoxygalactose transaminase
LPDIRKYKVYVDGIWSRNWLTNNGPLVNELELRLKEHLNVDHLLYLTNGTIAIQIAIKALGLKGRIITTPFSYVATTSSIVWENCTPTFVDIDPETYNIDASRIEEAITEDTTGILATHVFGNPCRVDEIELIAKKYGLSVIYDGAHAFACKYKGKSIFTYGDIATTSFHATKLFHTIEGGAVFTNSPELLRRMSFMRNFGHNGHAEFAEVGINGKNSEFHAAMGLAILPDMREILEARAQLTKYYQSALSGTSVSFQKLEANTEYNHSYFSVLFRTESELLLTLANLNDHMIFPRRYFYPSLSSLHYVSKTSTPISDKISSRILCLPFYVGLSFEEIDLICRIIKRSIRYSVPGAPNISL